MNTPRPSMASQPFHLSRYPPSQLLFAVLSVATILLSLILADLLTPPGITSMLVSTLIFFLVAAVVVGWSQARMIAHCTVEVTPLGFWLIITKPGLQMPRSETFIEWATLVNFQPVRSRRGSSLIVRFTEGKKIQFVQGDLEQWTNFLRIHFPDQEKRSGCLWI